MVLIYAVLICLTTGLIIENVGNIIDFINKKEGD